MKMFYMWILILISFVGYSFPNASKEQVETFNLLADECKVFQNTPRVLLSGSHFLHRQVPFFVKLKSMCGLESLELIYSRMKTASSSDKANGAYWPLSDLWGDLTHRYCVYKIPWNPGGIVYTWEGGAEFEEEQISFLLKEMRLAAKEGRKQDELVTRQLISCEGIFAFPTLFAELEAGKDDVIEILKLIWRNPKRRPTDMNSKSLRMWWAKNKEQYALPHQSPNFKKTKNIHNWERTGK